MWLSFQIVSLRLFFYIFCHFSNFDLFQLVKSKAGNDKYVEKGMNTFGNPHIAKVVQTDKIGMKDQAFDVTTWDMYDSFLELAEKEKKGSVLSDYFYFFIFFPEISLAFEKV